MIGFLEGDIRALGTHAILVTHGVGYKVATTRRTRAYLRVGEKAALYTYLAVREDALDLYGFLTEEELKFFELLLTVSGIGPKSALSVIDIASTDTIRSAIIQGKPEYLTKMSGIGKKTAEKIVLELRDKVIPDGTEKHLDGDEEAMEALQALGYSLSEARDTLRAVPDSVRGAQNRLREALKSMAP